MGMKKKDVDLNSQPTSTMPPVPPVPVAIVKKAPIQPLEQKAGDDKGFPPKTRDRSIEVQALTKSLLESPMLAQLTMGQDQTTAMKTFKEVFTAVLALYDGTK